MNHSSQRILVFCHDRLQSKVFYHCEIASLFYASPYRLFFFFSDASIKSKIVKIYPSSVGINLYGFSRPLRVLLLIRILLRINPDKLELIDTSVLSLLVVLITLIRGKNLLIWMRGFESQFIMSFNEIRLLRPSLFLLYLSLSTRIIFKEPRHLRILALLRLKHKSRHFHNVTPVNLSRFDREIYLFNKRPLKFLFFNRTIKERSLIPFLTAVIKLAENNSFTIHIRIIGLVSCSHPNQKSYIREIIKLASTIDQLEECSCLISPYTKESIQAFSDSHFFILPSMFTYANYSLLEAMSYGLIPLLTKSQWSTRLVPHSLSESGLVDFENTPAAWQDVLLQVHSYDAICLQKLSYESWLHHKYFFSLSNHLVAENKSDQLLY